VQQISNRLDAGRVLGIAKSKVYRHSYRKTIESAYRNGIPLLGKAVRGMRSLPQNEVDQSRLGPVTTIPSNKIVLKCLW
ncbi:MAG: hypothetical protein EB023_15185, partial [Flavobacteriia bacterium]|nr:hypothetical protein [Flavobacteriia bacterium]